MSVSFSINKILDLRLDRPEDSRQGRESDIGKIQHLISRLAHNTTYNEKLVSGTTFM